MIIKIPFYAALPSSTIDWNLDEGAPITLPLKNVMADEVRFMEGMADGKPVDSGINCTGNTGEKLWI